MENAFLGDLISTIIYILPLLAVIWKAATLSKQCEDDRFKAFGIMRIKY